MGWDSTYNFSSPRCQSEQFRSTGINTLSHRRSVGDVCLLLHIFSPSLFGWTCFYNFQVGSSSGTNKAHFFTVHLDITTISEFVRSSISGKEYHSLLPNLVISVSWLITLSRWFVIVLLGKLRVLHSTLGLVFVRLEHLIFPVSARCTRHSLTHHL